MSNKIQANSLSDLLTALIRIPSVNPHGDPGTTTENTGEQRMAEAIGAILTDLGAEVDFDEVEPSRPNVIGKFPGTAGKPEILLAPHLDTVGVEGMTVDPFGGEQREGKIFGRGASDTKGTMAAMLWALSGLGAEKIARLGVGVSFVGLIGEETGQFGSRHFARKYRNQYDFALVGEPTGNNIVYRHKGTLWLEISTRGKAAHGATPERGESAIAKMAEVITLLENDFRSELSSGAYFNELLGHPTINIGCINGGARTNIVSEHCSITVDFRITPELGADRAVELILDFLNQHDFNDTKVSVKLRSDPLNTSAENRFVQSLCALPSSPKLVGAPWFCDAAVLASEGEIPAVAAGPGDIAQAHTADEWIKESDLEEGALFYRQFLESAN